MALISESAEWLQLGSQADVPIFFKRQKVCDMRWQRVDLESLLVAVAPFGGSIATVRHPRKLVALSDESRIPTVRIFTSCGDLLAQFEFKKPFYTIGWTDGDLLCVLASDGMLHIYNVLGEHIRFVSTGAVETNILDAAIGGDACVVLTSNFDLLTVRDFSAELPKNESLAMPPSLEEKPYCIELVSSKYSPSLTPEVLLSPRMPGAPDLGISVPASGAAPAPPASSVGNTEPTGTVIAVDSTQFLDLAMKNQNPILKMTLSPNGKFVAAFDNAGNLEVFKSDFSRKFSTFSTKSKICPQQIAWSGVDALAVLWDAGQLGGSSSLVLLVGPKGDYEKFTYDGTVVLASECDGVRVIGNDMQEFIHRVPQPIVDIFRIGSVEPGALLFDAYSEFENKNASCMKTIREIQESLAAGVDNCVDAATGIWRQDLQQLLLRAASFGKSFCEFYTADTFTDTCRYIRILNNCREAKIAIPLSFAQFEAMGAEKLIERLMNRNKHLVAVRICEYLKLKTDSVLVHWACRKVRDKRLPDPEVLDVILSRLASFAQVPYHLIADAAAKADRSQLATDLLEKEPDETKVVPILLSMDKFDLALDRAMACGDSDLIYSVLFHIKERDGLSAVFPYLKSRPLIRDLFISYLKATHPEVVRQLFAEMDIVHESAMMEVMHAYEDALTAEEMASALARAREDFDGSRKEYSYMAKLTEEQLDLIKFQKEIDDSHIADGIGFTFLFSSLSDTLYQLLYLGDLKRSEKARSLFKVSDKRFWMVKIKALAAAGNWEQLEKFAKDKKSPVGYEPFVRACISCGSKSDGEKYVARVAEPKVRTDLWIELGNLEEAAQSAAALKDLATLEHIRELASTNRRMLLMVDQHIAKLQSNPQ